MSQAQIPVGDLVPGIVNVVIEIPRGTSDMEEYDEELDGIEHDPVLRFPWSPCRS